jgi:hypothetical protein
MEEAGRKLHLKGHLAGTGTEPTYGPGDLEGHLGFDGRYYVLDFARVFPPQGLSETSYVFKHRRWSEIVNF